MEPFSNNGRCPLGETDMPSIDLKERASQLLYDLGIAAVDPDWTGCDPVWSVLERIGDEGATFLVKIDGGRGPQDNGRYTVVVKGGPLKETFFRTDCRVLEEGLAAAIIHYAEACWK